MACLGVRARGCCIGLRARRRQPPFGQCLQAALAVRCPNCWGQQHGRPASGWWQVQSKSLILLAGSLHPGAQAAERGFAAALVIGRLKAQPQVGRGGAAVFAADEFTRLRDFFPEDVAWRVATLVGANVFWQFVRRACLQGLRWQRGVWRGRQAVVRGQGGSRRFGGRVEQRLRIGPPHAPYAEYA